jgi:hypothetical protein
MRPLYWLLGALLLLPLYIGRVFGISVEDFDKTAIKPTNLPGSYKDPGAPVETQINEFFQFGINLILYISGGMAVLFLIWGGIQYITSLGDNERMDNAKKTLKFALFGLLAVIFAYAVATNIISLIYRSTG